MNPSEAQSIEIVDFRPAFLRAFQELNRQWIEAHFEMEEEDHKALDNPVDGIIRPGGHIFISLLNGETVGTAALIRMNDPHYDYELAKMAVAPEAQGIGIGLKLGIAIIEKAKALGARNIYLESNTVLAGAIRLYRKLGFVEIDDHVSPYARCNIQMALSL